MAEARARTTGPANGNHARALGHKWTAQQNQVDMARITKLARPLDFIAVHGTRMVEARISAGRGHHNLDRTASRREVRSCFS